MPDLTPMTRQEKFLNGDTDLEPITRREYFYAGRESELPEGHQEPETREEWFIKEYREAGDVTVEEITITENGTTTAPSGKAYSPIHTNVPLPQNAYLLKSVANLPQAIASFNDGQDMVMPSLKVAIEPQQDLHGYDAPWVGGAGKNKLNLDFTNDTDSFSGLTFSHTDSTFKLKGTVSGSGYYIFNLTLPPNVDLNTDYTLSAIVTGTVERCLVGVYFKNDNTDVETIRVDISDTTPENTKQISAQFDNALFIIEGLQSGNYFDCEVKIQLEKGSSATTYTPYSNICPISGWDEVNVTVTDDDTDPTVSNVYTIDLDGTRYGVDLDVINGIGREYKEYPSYNGETLIGPWISDRDVYAEGTTPTIGAQVLDKGDISTFNTIPTAVKSLRGVNNVYANTGDIKDAEYFSKEV